MTTRRGACRTPTIMSGLRHDSAMWHVTTGQHLAQSCTTCLTDEDLLEFETSSGKL